jgi:hypothetical protein
MVAHGRVDIAHILAVSLPVADTKRTRVADSAAVADWVTPGTNITMAASIELVAADTVARRLTVAYARRFVRDLTVGTLRLQRSTLDSDPGQN